MRPTFFILFFLLTFFISNGSHVVSENDTRETPYIFRQNKGQWQKDIQFAADFGTTQLLICNNSFIWDVQNPNDVSDLYRSSHVHGSGKDHAPEQETFTVRGHVFQMKFQNSNKNIIVKGVDSSQHYSNYIKSNNPKNWASFVRDYKGIYYSELYDEVDLHLYLKEGQLKYDFLVHPGGDPNDIMLSFEGIKDIYIKKNKLHIENSINTFQEDAPFAYQVINDKKVYIPCAFKLKGQNVSFEIGKYNPHYLLYIDPILIFSSFSGSKADNWGMTATPGASGELYGGGVVFDKGYVTTIGAYDREYNQGDTDISISKFSADGSTLMYSTYLGGLSSEIPHSMIENSKGELVVFGNTSSMDFPVTTSAIQKELQDSPTGRVKFEINNIKCVGSDIIVTVLNSTGSGLVGSTYMGGSNIDGVNVAYKLLAPNYGDQLRGEVILDEFDNIYIATTTESKDFPITNNALQQSHAGGHLDAVIFTMDRTCSKLLNSTYLGGSAEDVAHSLKLNSERNIYVTGGTNSNDLNIPDGGYSKKNSGVEDAYVFLINNNLSQIMKGSYFGTQDFDQAYFVELNKEGSPFLFGLSFGEISKTPEAYGYNGRNNFIIKFNEDLSDIVLQTTVGNGVQSNYISPTAFLVDDCNRVFISGWGGIVNNQKNGMDGLELTSDAFQSATDGSDFYLAILEENMSSLLYSTYFGGFNEDPNPTVGDHVDGGTSRFSENGVVYHAVCAACGGTNSFPVTDGVVSEINGSPNCNLGVFKFDFEITEIKAKIKLDLDTAGCFPFTTNFINKSTGTSSFEWDFGDGNTSYERSPDHQYQEVGEYRVRLIAIARNSCVENDTAYATIKVHEAIEPIAIDTTRCNAGDITLTSRVENDNSSYLWNTGEETRQITVSESGTYIVTSHFANCVYTDTFNVEVIIPSRRLEDYTHCDESDLVIKLDPRIENIQWSTGETSKSITVDEEGTYSVTYNIGDCMFSDTGHITFPTLPKMQIIGDTVGCEGDIIDLIGSNIGKARDVSFLWSDGSTSKDINVSESGTYQLIGIEPNGCMDTATIDVRIIPSLPELENPSIVTRFCDSSTYRIDLSKYQNNATIAWSDNSKEYVREFQNKTRLTYKISNKCESLEGLISLSKSEYKKDELPMYIPNAFSPNEDFINDIFKPEYNQNDVDILSYEMDIFDRWGNLLYESHNIDNGWKGDYKDKIMYPSVFVYIIKINFFTCDAPSSKKMKGDVQVMQ